MITEENLNNLYNGVIESKELTTQELYNYGFKSEDLSKLIEQGKLQRIKRGLYTFTSFEDLYQCGEDLTKRKNYDKALKCFEKCYEMNSAHYDTSLQIFFSYIFRKDYDKASKYLNVLGNSDNSCDIADYNLYLYLLNIVTELPEKYKNYVKYIKYDDVKLSGDNSLYTNQLVHNKIRSALLRGKCFNAMSQIKEVINSKGINLRILTIKNLVGHVIEKENLQRKNILEDLKNKNYNNVIRLLNEKRKKQILNKFDEYTIILSQKTLEIQNSKNIPENYILDTDNFFEAIDKNNYSLALNLYENYAQKNNINIGETPVYILLKNICSLINDIRFLEENISQCIDNNINQNETDEIVENQNNSEILENSKINFSDIISFLISGDLEKTFTTLRKYLSFINKLDYEFLIVDLIKLSLIENDIAFTKPMITLTYLSRENFNFDLSNYIQEFYFTLSQNKFDAARIYLDIISKANKLGQNFILSDNLLVVLENFEKRLNYKRNNEVLDNVEKAYENIEVNLRNEIVKRNDTMAQSKAKETPKINVSEDKKVATVDPKKSKVSTMQGEKIVSITPIDDDRKLIESKYNLLLNDAGIVLLKPMNDTRIENILKIVKDYEDIDAFTIGEEKNKQIVLRYKSTIYEYIDFSELRIKGKDAYNEKDYKKCIEIHLKLLKHGRPKASVYAHLGLAYMKLFEIERAIEYMKIATNLSRKENGIYDFTQLINSLNGSVDAEDKKTFVRMNVDDFVDSNDNFGLGDITYITEYIYNSGLDVENACKQLRLKEEDTIILMLVYARDFYKQGEYEKGDQFLKYVEKAKNKTAQINKIFREVRTNKKFYKNRSSEFDVVLALTLHPKK